MKTMKKTCHAIYFQQNGMPNNRARHQSHQSNHLVIARRDEAISEIIGSAQARQIMILLALVIHFKTMTHLRQIGEPSVFIRTFSFPEGLDAIDA